MGVRPYKLLFRTICDRDISKFCWNSDWFRNMSSSVLDPPSAVRDAMSPKTAGIIIIGDEILKGDIRDENTHFLCKRFRSLGVRVSKVSVVSDSLDAIAQEVKKFSDRYDIVVTSGGIGPTHDDLTYEGIAQAFGEKLVKHEELEIFWSKFYSRSESLGDDNPSVKMSKIPESGRLIRADIGKFKEKFPFVSIKNIYVFPGIPTYLKTGFAALEREHFVKTVKFHDRKIFLNVHESHAIPALNDASKEFADSVKIGSYPVVDNPYFATRLTLESMDQSKVDDAYNKLVSRLDPQWIEKDADLLGNAADNLKDLIEMENSGFSKLLSDSRESVMNCFEEYREEEIFVCFNGGKDCTALLHLVHCCLMERLKRGRSATLTPPKPKMQVLYIRCKDSFQETEDFIRDTALRYNLDMTVVSGPLKPSLETLISGEKSHWKAVFMGTRRSDPHSDKMKVFQKTDAGWPDLMRVSPLLDWCYSDIWTFLRKLNVPYCSLYDKGYTSLGNRHNTRPNPELSYEENGTTKYRPAYTLQNPQSERNGRC